MKKCSHCAEEIQGEAIKCKYCGERLDKIINNIGKNIKPKERGIPTGAKICHWLVAIWTIFCIFGLYFGMQAVTNSSTYMSSAASAGLGCGGCIWGIIWCLPVIVFEIIAIAITISAKKR